jgi:hypothetical protein
VVVRLLALALGAGMALGLAAGVAGAAPGDLDSGFGSGGKALVGFAPGSADFARAVALQPDGRVVVAGYSRSSGGEQ